jgi:hypothetical protein
MILRLASSLLVASLLFRVEVSSAQQLKRFDAKSYPAQSFHVSHYDYPVGKFKVRIIQAKTVYETSSPPPSYCRAWLEVTEGGRVLRQAYFDDIDPVGSYFGIFVPERQPFSAYFLALKEGDYDGRLLLVGEDGTLTNLPGGGFFLTPDKRLIVGSHSSDYQSLFVIDVQRHRVVIDGAKEKLPGVDDWYVDKTGYFFTALDESGMPQDSNSKTLVIYRLDFNSLRVTKNEIATAYLKSSRKVETVRRQQSPDCSSVR